MKLSHYLILLAAAIIFGLAAVYQRVEVVRTGYGITDLLRERARLRETKRKLEVYRLREENPETLLRRAKRFGIELPENLAAPLARSRSVRRDSR
jgi:hypothetical protein